MKPRRSNLSIEPTLRTSFARDERGQTVNPPVTGTSPTRPPTTGIPVVRLRRVATPTDTRQFIPVTHQAVHRSSRVAVQADAANRSGRAPLDHRLVHGLFTAIAYAWASPNTLFGLTLTTMALLTGGRCRLHRGVIETHGGIVRFLLRRCTPLPGGAAAITFGHCVLAVDRETLDWTRPHERVHVRQSERWGPLFIPAYLLASLWALLRGRHFYRDNPFERQAYGRTR